jgi:hypothetical protein
MIYVLTCPCRQFDYVAYTDQSLANVRAGQFSLTLISMYAVCLFVYG